MASHPWDGSRGDGSSDTGDEDGYDAVDPASGVASQADDEEHKQMSSI